MLYQCLCKADVHPVAARHGESCHYLQDRVEASPEQMARCSAKAERFSHESGTLTRVVGWYHSHPHITVLPSHVDVRTQAMYQMLDPGFIGLIISTFNEVFRALCTAASLRRHFTFYRVCSCTNTQGCDKVAETGCCAPCNRTRQCTSRRYRSQRSNRCPRPRSRRSCLLWTRQTLSRPWQLRQQVQQIAHFILPGDHAVSPHCYCRLQVSMPDWFWMVLS